ncbi:MAG: ferritin-like domain-containing protein [Pseudomonadota bacterium]
MTNLFECAKRCLDAATVAEKVALTKEAAQAWREGRLSLASTRPPTPECDVGHPARPRLVPPRDVPQRSIHNDAGRAALFHAIAHIEFTAISLAWDAVYRFRGMPEQYYGDWVRVADEEAYHFELINAHLRELGHEYGDFDAHAALWEMAQATAHDVLVRMALVPRVLEARGLDVTPGIMKRLAKSGDDKAVAILEIIQRDEIGHVEIGTRWFRYCCAQRGLDPEPTFFDLISRYMKGQIRAPFHIEAREKAGFTDSELKRLTEVALGS